ncbi:MAG: hypothetical protein JNN05_03755 [Candidatus Omnitrophica bacterium]|nr:hypothetical protein [Candidatus Omnitrophota bacterium]
MSNILIDTVKPVLKSARLGYLNARQSVTGASVSLVNFGSAMMRSTTMNFFTPPGFRQENYDSRADKLRNDCYVTMPDFYEPQLIREVHEQFKKAITNESLITNHGYSRTIKNMEKMDEYIPSMVKLLRHEGLKRIMHSFYNSYFNLTSVSATRLYPVPEKDRTPEHLLSAVWHCDDVPVDLVHLVVYLHDVTPAHGPTKLVSRKRTRELMRMGYGRRYEIGIPQNVLEDEKYVKDLSSKAGTAHLMLPCLTLHRAGIPNDGLIRDSLFFSFRPGLEHQQFNRLSPIKRKMYPVLQNLGENRLYAGGKLFGRRTFIYA